MRDIVSSCPKVCAKCNQPFPKTMKIDGKKIYLHKREYCLDCSPLGTHHLHKHHLHKSTNPDKRNICKVCGREYKGGHGQRKDMCHSCAMTMQKKKKKLQIIEYLGGKCSICGYDRCPIVLQCHHLNRAEKEFMISRHQLKWETLVKELDKCILLCANCHGEQHASLIQEDKGSPVVKNRRKKKLQVVEYMGGKCVVCGYNKYAWALHCHHLDEDEKEFTVSSRTLKWETLVKEVDKCILLCANCHGEHHAGLIDLPISVR